MKTRYIDLIDQTFEFPQDEFDLAKDRLTWNDIDLYALLEEHGTPLKVSYLPRIDAQIEKARSIFKSAFLENGYQGKHTYFYCTKSSHFSFVIDRVLEKGAFLETSSAFDLDIVFQKLDEGKMIEDSPVICNGFKDGRYMRKIQEAHQRGVNVIPILDGKAELSVLEDLIDGKCPIGIRIATEEDPKFQFYTSRLGIGYKGIVQFYKDRLLDHDKFETKLLHFFVNTGMSDTAYYWNELTKCVDVYCKLKKICPTLDTLDIGGGMPIKNSLSFDVDQEYLIKEIITRIKEVCEENNVPEPNIFTEFGSYTVSESGATFFSVLHQKEQNDRERWNMIDGSFMTTLPDTWAINKRFIMLPINNWNQEYERVLLGGITCDSDDYYNSEQHINAIYFPKYTKTRKQYLGFFNTGAYQDSIGGYGGVQHCLIPKPKHIILDRDEDGKLFTSVFRDQQGSTEMLSLLGYAKAPKLVSQ